MTQSPRSPDVDHRDETRSDVVVVGGGLAGLVAALTARRLGAQVTLVEARRESGGRARSDEIDGHVLNHGAHALYLHGAGAAVLRDLGVTWSGHAPRQSRLAWSRGGERIPARGPGAIGGRAGLQAVRRLLAPGRRRSDAAGRSLAEWMDRHVPDAGRGIAETLARTSTYAADLGCLDAEAGLRQIDLGRRGVAYLDGGWGTLVTSLVALADGAGVERLVDRVDRIDLGDEHHTVGLRQGGERQASVVVLANGGPVQASHLVPASATLRRWAEEARPVAAACLDLVLRPGPGHRGPLYGLGEPTYLVDHSRSARLGPDGARVLHGLVYEPSMRRDLDPRPHLEGMAELVAPGWRDQTERATFRQQAVVAHDRPQPGRAGAGAPQPEVGDVPRVFVAGDWITRAGMLADAAIASAAEAGRSAAQQVRPAASVATS